MRNIMLACSLALLITFSSGCKSTGQSGANSNNSNISTVTPNPPNSASLPSPAVPQQDVTQPGASPPNNASSTSVAPMDSASTSLSMLAMDFHTTLLQGDKAKLDPMLADDYKRTRIDGTVVNKAQELASLKKTEDMLSMEAQPAQIKGDAATVSAKLTLNSKDMSEQKKASWQSIDTFKKRGGRWVVVSSVEKKN